MEYISILSFLLLLTIFLEWKYKVHLYHSAKERFIIVGVFFIVGAVWDYFAITRGHWNFPTSGNSGIFIGPIPLEEYIFFLVIPYWVITTYKVLERKLHNK